MTTFVLKLTPNAEGKRKNKGRKIFYFDARFNLESSFRRVMLRAENELNKQASQQLRVGWRRYYRTALEVRND